MDDLVDVTSGLSTPNSTGDPVLTEKPRIEIRRPGAAEATTSGLDETSLQRISNLWHGLEAFLMQSFLPKYLESNSPGKSGPRAEIPLAIATSISELLRGPGAVLLACCVSSLTTVSIIALDQYVVSSDGWNMSFSYLAAQCIIHLATMIAGRTVSVVDLVTQLDWGYTLLWLLISLLSVVKNLAYLKALQSLTIPIWSIFNTLAITAIGPALGHPAENVLGILSITLLMMSCFHAVLGKLLLTFYITMQSQDARLTFRAILIASVKEALFDLGPAFAWMGLYAAVTVLYILSSQTAKQSANINDRDGRVYCSMFSALLLLVCCVVFEDFSTANLSRVFPIKSRWKLTIAAVFSSLAPILHSSVSAWCLRVMSWQTHAIFRALDIIPITVGCLISSESANMPASCGLSEMVFGFISGLAILLISTRKWRTQSTTWTTTRSLVVVNILSSIVLFGASGLFGGIHHAVLNLAYPVPDWFYDKLYSFFVGLLFFISFYHSWNLHDVSWRRHRLTMTLYSLSLAATLLSSLVSCILAAAIFGTFYSAILCAMGGVVFVLSQKSLSSTHELPTNRQQVNSHSS